MTADIIQADYEKLAQIATRFEQQVEVVEELRSRLAAAVDRLRDGGWEGRGATAFFVEMDGEIFPALTRETDALTRGSEVTRQIIQILQAAEREAASRFGGGDASVPLSPRDTSTGGTPGGPGGGTSSPESEGGILDWIKDGVKSVFGAVESAAETVVSGVDSAVDKLLGYIVPQPKAAGKESITFELKGDLTVPGAEVGLPGSVKLKAAKSATLAHNADGTYTLTISSGGGAGLEETTGGAEGSVTVGNQKHSAGLEASGSVGLVGGVEITYKFDPNKPGDMTKMAAFAASMGIPGLPGVDVAPPLYLLKDNLQGVKISGGLEAEGKLVAALGEGKLGGSIIHAGEMRLNDAGQREIVYGVEGSGSGSVSAGFSKVLQYKEGGEAKLQLQGIMNVDTGATSTQATLTLTHSGGVAGSDLHKYLPPGAKLTSATFGGDSYDRVTIEYTLDQPVESVRDAVFNGSGEPNLSAITQNSKIAVKTTQGDSFALGAGGSVALPTQKVGVSGEVGVKRESEQTVWTFDGSKSQTSTPVR